jgi:hypothetical protein
MRDLLVRNYKLQNTNYQSMGSGMNTINVTFLVTGEGVLVFVPGGDDQIHKDGELSAFKIL